MRLYIVLSIVLVALSGSSFALQCYKCNEGCDDPFDPARASIVTCWTGFDKCVAYKDVEKGTVYRGCGLGLDYGPQSPSYCQTVVKDGTKRTGCQLSCGDDLCNGQSFDTIDHTLNCYDCTYEGNDRSGCSPTGFDPNADGMKTITCQGSCIIMFRSHGGKLELERSCLPVATYGECEPGCDEFGQCLECCKTNLCNGPSK